jgi:hypothetical protein
MWDGGAELSMIWLSPFLRPWVDEPVRPGVVVVIMMTQSDEFNDHRHTQRGVQSTAKPVG